MAGYWRRLHDRAFRETLAAFRLESMERSVVIPILIACLVAVLIWVIGGQFETSTVIRGVASAGALMLLFPGVYLWKLRRLPEKMDAELRTEVEALRVPVGGPIPDWPIREFFDYLKSTADNSDDPHWNEKIGRFATPRTVQYVSFISAVKSSHKVLKTG